MRLKTAAFAVVACALSGIGMKAKAADFFFKDGDRAVILGDSITEQLLYSNYVEMWTITRFPKWDITFRNSGIGGDTSGGGNGRFNRDVLWHKATALTVDFGMNDGGYKGFDEPRYKNYMKGVTGIADQAKAAGVRVAWLTPSPVEKGEDGPALIGYNETLEKYSAGVKETAEKYGSMFSDQFHPFVQLIDKARAENPKNRIGGGDAVHPGPAGQAVMAWGILTGLNFPTLVSSAEIDAAGGKLVNAEKCEISGVTVKDGGVTFQRLDQSLPFFPAEAKAILKWHPIDTDMNKYNIKVTGLKEGKYVINIGGVKVAEQTSAELAAGVNLAPAVLAAGPIADQVKSVWTSVKEKNQMYHDRIFRGIVLGGGVPDWLDLSKEEAEAKKQAAMEKRMEKVRELDGVIKKKLEMKANQFEIVPAK